MSINFDGALTLSILSNTRPPNPLRVQLCKHFDTLSVYRGSWCEQVARGRSTRSACNDSVNHEKSTNPATQTSRRRKTSKSDSYMASTLQRLPARQAQSSLVKP